MLHFAVDSHATRKRRDVQDFVASFDGRAQLHFTPTHAWWLNQIELWFGAIDRQLLNRGRFTSTDDLAQKGRASVGQ